MHRLIKSNHQIKRYIDAYFANNPPQYYNNNSESKLQSFILFYWKLKIGSREIIKLHVLKVRLRVVHACAVHA